MVALRLFLYGIATALLLDAIVTAAEAGYGAVLMSEDLIFESGRLTLESGQLILALVCSGVFLGAAALRGPRREFLAAASLLPLFAAVRELDAFFDEHLFEGAYKLINAPVVLLFLYFALTRLRVMLEQARDLASTAAFAVMFFGFFMVVGFSQIVGQKELWQAAMGDGYLRLVKDTVEETSELVGYLFIVFGSLEALLLERKTRGQRQSA